MSKKICKIIIATIIDDVGDNRVIGGEHSCNEQTGR